MVENLTTLRYFSYVHGQLHPRYLPITVRSDVTILAILGHIAKRLDQPSSCIFLWKPREFLPKGAHDRLRSLLRQHGSDLSKLCNEIEGREARISDIFSSGVPADEITLVAEVPKPESVAGDAAEHSEHANHNLTKLTEHCGSPDLCGEHPILDGRYGNKHTTVAPPVEDFHYTFAQFKAGYCDESMQLPEDFVRLVGKITDDISMIKADELCHQSCTSSLLSTLLSSTFKQLVNSNRASADHIQSYSRERPSPGLAGQAFVEEKAELGSSGDGSVHGSFSYTQHWTDINQKELLEACFCPSFVIALAGPYIIICGAIFTRVNDDANALRIARVFYALGNALLRLRSFYAEVEKPTDNTTRYFPLATAYRDGNRIVRFKYMAPLKDTLEANVTYRAVECEGHRRPIVVKFVERYGVAAHRLLASEGLAPALLYYGDIGLEGPEAHGCGTRKMMVMEYIAGTMAHAMNLAGEEQTLPDGVHSAVKRAVKLLHDKHIVHGDIRLGNVIVAEPTGANDDNDVGKRVKIVDFD
ncbi:hypothetical protein EVG20_g2962 [Dentipellis fragilis]|uniref:Protein kinase domain-containing protein n=1 Tax=Dentipellis fragilis TaxID=205917 RepID=A0A4Y9Z6W9_9AGAM|nr:hypothetical protein EVG20_g2962 [Dentipellis fragilis]